MKNVINYYYNLFPMEIHQKNNEFYFNSDGYNYIFSLYDKDVSKIDNIDKFIGIFKYINVEINVPILNMQRSYITNYNDKLYILLKINVLKNNTISLNDILFFNNLTYGMFSEYLNVIALTSSWGNKIDYFEYQVNQFGIKYQNMRYSFNYFVGLAENALCIVNELVKAKIPIIVAHERIKKNTTKSDLYNSLNFIYDSKIRDVSEYIKNLMFTENVDYIVKQYFSYNDVSKDEATLFFARILFPTYYFDICEEAFKIEDDQKIEGIVENIDVFELNLKRVYRFLKPIYNLSEIEWLIR